MMGLLFALLIEISNASTCSRNKYLRGIFKRRESFQYNWEVNEDRRELDFEIVDQRFLTRETYFIKYGYVSVDELDNLQAKYKFKTYEEEQNFLIRYIKWTEVQQTATTFSLPIREKLDDNQLTKLQLYVLTSNERWTSTHVGTQIGVMTRGKIVGSTDILAFPGEITVVLPGTSRRASKNDDYAIDQQILSIVTQGVNNAEIRKEILLYQTHRTRSKKSVKTKVKKRRCGYCFY